MIRTIPSLALALIAVTGACGRGANHTADTTLNTDLSLAAKAKGYKPLDSMSAVERGAATNSPNALSGRTPVATNSTGRTVHRSTSSGEVSTRRSSTVSSTSSSQGGEVVVKHTKRDAAIGAGAGAVLGAMTSRDKVKGGILGGVAGGVLGGIIGHTVDVQK